MVYTFLKFFLLIISKEYKFGERDQKIHRTKRAMTISDDVIGEIERFKYLGSFVQSDGALAWNKVVLLNEMERSVGNFVIENSNETEK